jgi:lipoprotein-releasing system ATP-binding protein
MILRASNIWKKFGSLDILKGVNLEVEKAEVVSIVGKSGAGKSTLLHIIGTLEGADSGEVVINGSVIGQMGSSLLASFRNRHIGFVFQFHHLLPEFTAIENVCIPGLIGNFPEVQVKHRASALLESLGLAHRLDHKPAQLSGGEQQRVAMARALINNPSIVFADEPTGNLDSASSAEMHQLIGQLRAEHQLAFVIVTHNRELAALSDRCLEMRDGLLLG